nr:hypothetical protein [Tanacetum cinerariifolium]
MNTTIEQQVAIDEALVPHAQRDMLHICLRVHGQSFDEPPFEEEILAFIRFLGHSATIRTPRLTTSGKGKQTANASKATSISGLSELAMTEAQQLKLVTKRSMQHTHISQVSGSGADEGTGADNEGKDGDDDKEDEGDDGGKGDSDDDDDMDDEEEGGDDDQEYDDEYAKETRDEESFDHIPQTLKNSDDEGNGEEDLGLNVGGEKACIKEEEEEEDEDELYRDVNINQGRGLQTTQEVEDSHVTLTPINPDVKVAIQIQSNHLRDEAQKENDEFLKTVDENMQKIIKEQVKKQVKVQVSKILPIIEQTVNEQLEAKVLTRSSHSSRISYAIAADLSEMELKKILIEKMEGNKSIQRSNEQRNLYKAVVEAYESDKIILDTYGETVTLKRRRDDDADKDEEPSAGPDQESKRRREGKEPESASAPIETATRSADSESAFAKEPVQTTSQIEEPSHPEFDTGAEDQPIVQSSQHPEWFSQQQKPPSPNRDWNKTAPAIHGRIQPWISELAKQNDSRSSFNKLMDTPLDFFNFLINRLKVDTLTPELLADQLDWVNPKGQQYPHNLLKPLPLIPNIRGCRVIPFEDFINNDLEYLRGGASSRKYTTSITKTKATGVSHWGRKRQHFYGFAINRESARDVYSKRRIIAVTELKIVEWHNYKHLDWITMRRDDDKLYKFKEGDFKRLRIQDIEDMLLLLVQGKLTNLTVEERFSFNNKDKKNRLMRIDELHKFSDGTLTDVHTALDDRLKGIRMQYLPQSFWRKSDKDRASAMI